MFQDSLYHTDRTVIAGKFALWTCAIELHATDTAEVVVRHVPSPRGDGVVGCDFDLHDMPPKKIDPVQSARVSFSFHALIFVSIDDGCLQ